MSEGPLLKVEDLIVEYPTRAGVVRAVDRVSLEIYPREILGLVGESGCGKSTLGMAILRLLRPPGRIAGGRIWFRGRNLLELPEREMRRIRGRHISMVFQDPMTSLNPLQRVGDHIVEAIRVHERGTSRKAALARARELFGRLGIPPERLNDFPHQLSGGMRQRVMIALALALNADLILADEPTTSLDVIVEAQFLDLLKELRDEFGVTLVLISHNLGIVAQLADRVAVMYAGRLAEVGPVEQIFLNPRHPYTRGLLNSVPSIRLEDPKALQGLEGSPPNLAAPPPGCRFHPRCPDRMAVCRRREPAWTQLEEGHGVSCFLYEEVEVEE